MCSIIGAYRLKPSAKIHEKFISQGMDLMRHRGPDFEKYEIIDDILLIGHQRLSIIDVSPNGNMPMHTENSIISFNGEIYNYLELKKKLDNKYKFTTSSDTEVLQKGFEYQDINFLHKVNGMFAFAFYNKHDKKLRLVRDRFGVKPLNYLIQDDTLYFSSEIKPLIYITKQLTANINYYEDYIKETTTDYNEETFIKNIFQIPAGHYLEIDNNKFSTKKWYHANDYNFDHSIFFNKRKTIEYAEELLTDAISIRLRSDVPLCITLSGGLDSTVIYTLINEHLHNDISAYTFVHPEKNIDESYLAEALARSYGKKINKVYTNTELNIQNMLEALDFLEFPNWSVAIIAYMEIYKKLSSDGFKVVIEGHGSDEELGGYPYMIESAIYEYWTQHKIIKMVQALNTYREINKWSDFNLNKPAIYNILPPILHKAKNNSNFHKTLLEATNYAFDHKILPIVLRTFDRLTMRSSMESRSPFMDYRVVEFFKALPIDYKVSLLGSKAILREILKKYGKTEIYKNQKKQGFTLGLPRYYNNETNKSYIKKMIQEFNMPEFQFFKNKALDVISKKIISINDIDLIWKISSLSYINSKYGL